MRKKNREVQEENRETWLWVVQTWKSVEKKMSQEDTGKREEREAHHFSGVDYGSGDEVNKPVEPVL